MRATDLALLILCAAAILAGPAMALQELVKASQETAVGLVVEPGAAPGELDVGFRATWRVALLAGIVAMDALGCVVLLRVGRHPRVRAASGRLVALLIVGLAAIDAAFLFDGRYLAEGSYALRALFVAWMYPLGGILAAGSVLRLGEVHALLGGPR